MTTTHAAKRGLSIIARDNGQSQGGVGRLIPQYEQPLRMTQRSQISELRKVLTSRKHPKDIRFPLPENAEKAMAVFESADGDYWLLYDEEAPGYSRNRRIQLEAEVKTVSSKLHVWAASTVMIGELIKDLSEQGAGKEKLSETDAETGVYRLIEDAFAQKASDIHIHIAGQTVTVEYRIKGEINLITKWAWSASAEQSMALVRSMYNTMANSKETAFNPKKPQNADISRHFGGKVMRLRYSHISASPNGIHVVLRLLQEVASAQASYSTLGITKPQEKILSRIIRRTVGLILVSGTTGSGKSTTVANVLSDWQGMGGGKKTVTIEDPVEYVIPGVVHSAVVRTEEDNASGVNRMAEGISSALRRDPDRILVGEVRDQVTASAALKAVQSGHLVISTIHAQSALAQVDRLEDIGMSRGTIGSPGFFAGSIHQRLVKVPCPHCATSLEMAVREGIIENDLFERVTRSVPRYAENCDQVRVRSKTGCSKCTKGRDGP